MRLVRNLRLVHAIIARALPVNPESRASMSRIETTHAKLPDELSRALGLARHIAVLTGAGVSAESGIPTFREAQTGLWARHDPASLATPKGFERDPATVWSWYQWRRELIAASRPNAGHYALAELEETTAHFTLITQNVDGFHRMAGSTRVLELHGNIHRNICTVTGRPIEEEWIRRHAQCRPPPSPHHPDGLARPDVVWFGEALDGKVLEAAFEAAADCDFMIVAGTAGAVQPAASIPLVARDAGATLVDINPEQSELSTLADWHLAGASATWLPALSARRKRGRD